MKPAAPHTDAAIKAPQLVVFALLVTIGVVGRWGQPDWSVTPLAAVGLMAGYALPRTWLAMAVPVTALVVSNLLLPSYQNPVVALTVVAAMTLPALLGRGLRRPVGSAGAGLARLAACSVAPSIAFYLTTNLAVWASQSMYPKTAAGLAECYAAAVPFFRQMLAGDVAYTAVLFTVAAAAGAYSLTGVAAAKTDRATA